VRKHSGIIVPEDRTPILTRFGEHKRNVRRSSADRGATRINTSGIKIGANPGRIAICAERPKKGRAAPEARKRNQRSRDWATTGLVPCLQALFTPKFRHISGNPDQVMACDPDPNHIWRHSAPTNNKAGWSNRAGHSIRQQATTRAN
jgi:hypothetical protein